MDVESKIAALLELCSKLELQVRPERLGGSGGGLCRLKSKSIMFIDLDAEPEARYERLAAGLAGWPGIDDLYVVPEVRADLDRLKKLHNSLYYNKKL